LACSTALASSPVHARTIELNPSAASSHHDLGVALIAAGRLEQAADALAAALRLDPRLAEWVDTAVVPLYPPVTELFGTDKPFTVLLRPDNYIAAIWPGLDSTPAQQWLANIITSPSP